ncbi:hypothetical protein [Micromonospora humi]|uniref:hypothetical protein n=1 Tax=Micromonospora humi TaxID=745366 RepID=UPI0015866CC9|nr:hypothetical protein [Micromonospora humi]
MRSLEHEHPAADENDAENDPEEVASGKAAECHEQPTDHRQPADEPQEVTPD